MKQFKLKQKKYFDKAKGMIANVTPVKRVSNVTPIKPIQTPSERCKRLAKITPTPGKARVTKKYRGSAKSLDFGKENIAPTENSLPLAEHSYSHDSSPMDEAIRSIIDQNQFQSSNVQLSETERNNISECLKIGGSGDLAKIIFQIKSVRLETEKLLTYSMSSLCDRLCSTVMEPGPSVLRNSGNPVDVKERYAKIIIELHNCNLFLLEVFKAVCSPVLLKRPKSLQTVHWP
jgi:hypothetical protein